MPAETARCYFSIIYCRAMLYVRWHLANNPRILATCMKQGPFARYTRGRAWPALLLYCQSQRVLDLETSRFSDLCWARPPLHRRYQYAMKLHTHFTCATSTKVQILAWWIEIFYSVIAVYIYRSRRILHTHTIYTHIHTYVAPLKGGGCKARVENCMCV
jgi:hypothetical protein